MGHVEAEGLHHVAGAFFKRPRVDQEVIDFANREMDNVVLSLDGRKEIHDALRVDYAGNGNFLPWGSACVRA